MLLIPDADINCICLSFVLQRCRSHINVDNISFFTTPRKLIRSLQEADDVNSDFSQKQTRKSRSPASVKFQQSPAPSRKGFSREVFYDDKQNGNLCNGAEQVQGVSESVSSTDDLGGADMQVAQEMVPENKAEVQNHSFKKTYPKTASRLVLGLIFFLLAVFSMLMWNDDQNQRNHLVPT